VDLPGTARRLLPAAGFGRVCVWTPVARRRLAEWGTTLSRGEEGDNYFVSASVGDDTWARVCLIWRERESQRVAVAGVLRGIRKYGYMQ
jgi:hypothetical protein